MVADLPTSKPVELPPLLVPEREATRLLGGISSRTLFALREKGLPHVKVGARVMYSPRDLEQWIEKQKSSQT